jgi:hypothetical protein
LAPTLRIKASLPTEVWFAGGIHKAKPLVVAVTFMIRAA